MSSESENLRIFLGLPIEAQDGDALKEIFLAKHPQAQNLLRWVPDIQYHLTLRFLPEFPRAHLPQLIAKLDPLSFPKLKLNALQISEFPGPGGHSLVANVRLTQELAMMFHEISKIFKDFGFPSENHSFRPHITLAKIKKNQFHSPIEKIGLKNYDIVLDRFILYQSHVDDHGSHYTVLHTFLLK
jgi:2'-5' RNA ligase